MAVLSKQLGEQDPNTDYSFVEHFISSAIGASTAAIGTASGGSATPLGGQANAPGVTRLGTGATATGSYTLRYASSLSPPGVSGTQSYHLHIRFRLPIAPVSTTEGCFWFLGFSGNSGTAPGEPVEGVYVYIDNVDGNVYFASSRAGTKTYPGSVAYTSPGWIEAKISLLRGGTARMSLQPAGSPPTTVVFPATAVPTVSVGIQMSILKTSGTVARSLDIDFVRFSVDTALP